jgi:polar amino acid transport system permease protein
MAQGLTLMDMLALSPPGWGGVLLRGALASVQIAFLAYCFGLMLGLLGALGKLTGPRPVKFLINGYTTIIRAVPELILVVALYYAGTDGLNFLLDAIGIGPVNVSGFVAAIFVLAFVQGAYSTEVLRAAILSIPIGQVEAARAFGMSAFLRFRRVVLPAMLAYAIPGLANLWMIIIKDSALVAVVGYQELALATRQAAGMTKSYFMFYLVAAGLYLTITLISNQLFKYAERHVRRGQPAVG